MFWHYSREGKHGLRAWWHFGDRSVFCVELSWWSHFCHAGIHNDDEGWTLGLALPPLAIWVTLDDRRLWLPQYKTIASWETPPREIWLPDQRRCEASIHDWTIHIYPWSKSMEWSRRDPWWVRGVSLDLKQFVLGREYCETTIVKQDIPVTVPMPEGIYKGLVSIERRTWKRPRWFSRTQESAWLKIPKGIPHAGKGENSWDCGDDGLFGIGGDTIEDAIGRAVSSVLKSRLRYGNASDEAITEALQ